MQWIPVCNRNLATVNQTVTNITETGRRTYARTRTRVDTNTVRRLQKIREAPSKSSLGGLMSNYPN